MQRVYGRSQPSTVYLGAPCDGASASWQLVLSSKLTSRARAAYLQAFRSQSLKSNNEKKIHGLIHTDNIDFTWQELLVSSEIYYDLPAIYKVQREIN
jgi:hypothetical protein